MSESRELDTGEIDQDGKEEAEEAKAKRQIVSDSSEGNDQTVIAPSDVPPEAELGDSSEGAFQEEQQKAAEEGRELYPQNELDPEEDDEDDPDVFLFEMPVLKATNLTIPAKIAREYFPTLSFTGEENTLEIDNYEQTWNVPFAYNQDIDGFTPTNDQWQQISNRYNLFLFAPCSILFYEPAYRLHTAHYFIQFERRTEYQVQNLAPVFKDEDFLFEVELDASDIGMSRLFLPCEIVHEYFKVICIPPSQRQVAMKFTDAQGKNWYMEMIRYSKRQYMIIKWWGAFVRERGLEAMDAIRFYKHDNPSHLKHFYIAIVKRGCRGANANDQAGGGSRADAYVTEQEEACSVTYASVPPRRNYEEGQCSYAVCVICGDTFPQGGAITRNTCGHTYCAECFPVFLSEKIQESAIKVKCPVSDCETLFGPESVARFIPEPVFDRWVSCLTESSVLADPVYIKCPFESCGELFVDDERGFLIRACTKCWRVFCMKCRVGWHMGKSCSQYEVEVKSGDIVSQKKL